MGELKSRHGWISRREDPFVDESRWYETVSSETRSSFEDRKNILISFNALDSKEALEEVAERVNKELPPERALWEAVHVMMSDEILRNSLLLYTSKESAKRTKPEIKEQHWEEYRKLIARYRALVELGDQSPGKDVTEREIIPHVKLSHLRGRLADLLANQHFYFPDKDVSMDDRQEAFKRLQQAFTNEVQSGKKAEYAVEGILRYGPQWLRGGTKFSKAFLNPAIHIERTMPREDIFRETRGRKIGQFNGFDFLLRLPGKEMAQGVQLKTGEMSEASGHVNASASPTNIAYARLTTDPWMKIFNEHALDIASYEAYTTYAHAVEELVRDIARDLALDELTCSKLSGVLLPLSEREVRAFQKINKTPPPSWAVTFGDVSKMLKQNKSFVDFLTLQGIPTTIDAKNFSVFSDILRRLRAEHPQELFWQDWPVPPKPNKTTSVKIDYVPRYAR